MTETVMSAPVASFNVMVVEPVLTPWIVNVEFTGCVTVATATLLLTAVKGAMPPDT